MLDVQNLIARSERGSCDDAMPSSRGDFLAGPHLSHRRHDATVNMSTLCKKLSSGQRNIRLGRLVTVFKVRVSATIKMLEQILALHDDVQKAIR